MKLLTPGPLSTTERVRKAMQQDRCTWDDDYKKMTMEINERLLQLANVDPSNYTSILMQGSGSFVVESVFTSTIKQSDHVMIITNGAYGKRMVQIARKIGLSFEEISFAYDQIPNDMFIEEIIKKHDYITHIAMVHCETTTGMLNPIETIGAFAKKYGKTFIVDAMSSFGGVPIDIDHHSIDYLISSANKCIHGVPGFGFVIAKKTTLSTCENTARSVALDLFAQWETMEKDGKWRFTSPTHAVAAFLEALLELEEFGGIEKRHDHYLLLNQYLRKEMKRIGIQTYIDEACQSPIITTFYYPTETFQFTHFYEVLKKKGFILYPGKLTDVGTFRIGNIGDISLDDMKDLIRYIETYMVGMKDNRTLEELTCEKHA